MHVIVAGLLLSLKNSGFCINSGSRENTEGGCKLLHFAPHEKFPKQPEKSLPFSVLN